jgi:hypothetical protein
MSTAIGFDTSCYTTSVALARDGQIIASRRRLLTVEQGERGLMQSEGVFQHETRLPELIEQLMQEAGVQKIDAVGASTRPRPVDGSYMPVFTVGEGYGRSLAAVLGVPFIATSHQEGHIRAAMVDTALTYGEEILAVHLSGGTTEVLHVGGAVREADRPTSEGESEGLPSVPGMRSRTGEQRHAGKTAEEGTHGKGMETGAGPVWRGRFRRRRSRGRHDRRRRGTDDRRPAGKRSAC